MNPLLPLVIFETIALIFFAGWFIMESKITEDETKRKKANQPRRDTT